MPKVIMVP